MTSGLHTSIRDRNHALHRGEISAQRPPPSLSTGLGNLAYRGTSELKIRNVTVYPVACRKSVNTGLSRNAHCSGAPHSCASLKKNPPPIHIATPGRQRTDSMRWRSCAIHCKVLGVKSVALFLLLPYRWLCSVDQELLLCLPGHASPAKPGGDASATPRYKERESF